MVYIDFMIQVIIFGLIRNKKGAEAPLVLSSLPRSLYFKVDFAR
jgi:hypothetical protein